MIFSAASRGSFSLHPYMHALHFSWMQDASVEFPMHAKMYALNINEQNVLLYQIKHDLFFYTRDTTTSTTQTHTFKKAKI